MTDPADRARPYAGLLGRIGARLDAFVNIITGAGTLRDRTTYGFFGKRDTLLPVELTDMFNGEDIPRRIVSTLPRECQRQGYALSGPGAEALTPAAARLGLPQALCEAHTWARLYGGAIVFVMSSDGADPEAPYAGGHVRGFQVFDKRRVTIAEINDDATSPEFGRPLSYMISPIGGGYKTSKATFTAHASRCILFGGADTDEETRLNNAHWDLSVLQSVYGVLQGFAEADAATTSMLSEASQGILKLAGLIRGLAGGQIEALQKRVTWLDMMRGNTRSIVLDADPKYGEDFTRSQVSFSGVPDMLTRKMQRVASAAELPMSLLFGNMAAGLNSSDDNELRGFYDRVKAHQTQYLEPKLHRALWAIDPTAYTAGVHVRWLPLWQQSPKEAAETRAAQANADAIYLSEGVATPEEIARSRFTAEGWSGETHINASIRPAIAPAPSPPVATPPAVPSAPNGARPAPAGTPGPTSQ